MFYKYLIGFLALASYGVAGPQPGGPSSLYTTLPSGTWTYYTTLFTMTTVPTLTETVTGLAFETFTVTDSRTVTETTTSYDATVAGVTSTVPFWLTTTYVDPPASETSGLSVVSVPTPSGFTPILSAFPYTASVTIITTTSTVTYGIDHAYADDPTSTDTLSNTITEGYAVETQTVSIAGTLTVTDSTDYVVLPTFATSTETRVPLATHYAICDENSGNYANKFPFGKAFADMAYGANGDSTGYTTLHSLDSSGVYYNETLALANKVDCCNYAMSDPLTAFGYWEPALYYGRLENVCYVFKVKDQGSCQPSEVKYTLLYATDNTNSTDYYAFNGPCGRVTPDHHNTNYYYYGGKYSPEDAP